MKMIFNARYAALLLRQGARTDLTQLVNMGLLRVMKVKREFVYYPAPDLEERAQQF